MHEISFSERIAEWTTISEAAMAVSSSTQTAALNDQVRSTPQCLLSLNFVENLYKCPSPETIPWKSLQYWIGGTWRRNAESKISHVHPLQELSWARLSHTSRQVLLRSQSYSVFKLSLHLTLSVLIMGYSQEANPQKPSFISAVHGLSRL